MFTSLTTTTPARPDPCCDSVLLSTCCPPAAKTACCGQTPQAARCSCQQGSAPGR